MNGNYRRRLTLALVFAVLLLTSAPRAAQAVVDRYWRGVVNENWSSAFSWFGSGGYNALPNDGTGLAHFDSGGSGQLTSNVDTPWNIDGIEFAADAPAYTLTGSTLSIGADGVLNLSGVLQKINNNITVTADQNWNVGQLGIGSSVTVADHFLGLGANNLTTLNSTGSIQLTGASGLNVSGDAYVDGGQIVDESDSGLWFANGGTLTVTNSGSVTSLHSLFGPGPGSSGSLTVTAGSIFTSGDTYLGPDSSSFITVEDGSADLGDFTDYGTANFVGGIVTIQSVASSDSSTITNFAGATAYLGPWDQQRGTTNFEAGVVYGDTFDLGYLFGATANFDGGSAYFNRFTLEPDGIMNINGGKAYFGAFLNNGGTLNFTAGLLGFNSLTVGMGGALGTNVALQANQELEVSGTTTVDSFRTLALDGGSLATSALVNNGTFDFQRGRLAITGAGGLSIGAGGSLGTVVTLGANQLLEVTNTATISSDGLLVMESGGSFAAGTVDNGGEILLDGLTATLDGTTINNTGLLRGDGKVTANVNNNTGGEIRAEAGKRLKFDGSISPNAGLLSLQGGTAEFAQHLTNGSDGQILGRGTLRIGAAGLVNHGHVALSSGITDVFGDVFNDTSDTAKGISISGNADVTFWDDVNNVAGSLFRVSSGSSATFFGTFSGAGISGAGDVYFEADVTPGASPTRAIFGGNVSFGSVSDLVIELGGTAEGTEFDHVDVDGLLSLGGTLDVVLIDDFLPQAGQSFDILDWGTRDGGFAAINLPTLAGLTWDTSRLYSRGELILAAAGLLGDYNGNGTVDAADYTVWRDALTAGNTTLSNDPTPATVDETDFAYWRAHFGETLGSGAGAGSVAAVPEPTSAALAVAALLAFFKSREREGSSSAVASVSHPRDMYCHAKIIRKGALKR